MECSPQAGLRIIFPNSGWERVDSCARENVYVQPTKDRAERILKDLENRRTTGLAADREAAMKSARERRGSSRSHMYSPKSSVRFCEHEGHRWKALQLEGRAFSFCVALSG